MALRLVNHSTNGQPYDPETSERCDGSDSRATDPDEEGNAHCAVCDRWAGTFDAVLVEREACAALAEANGDNDTAAAIRARD